MLHSVTAARQKKSIRWRQQRTHKGDCLKSQQNQAVGGGYIRLAAAKRLRERLRPARNEVVAPSALPDAYRLASGAIAGAQPPGAEGMGCGKLFFHPWEKVFSICTGRR